MELIVFGQRKYNELGRWCECDEGGKCETIIIFFKKNKGPMRRPKEQQKRGSVGRSLHGCTHQTIHSSTEEDLNWIVLSTLIWDRSN